MMRTQSKKQYKNKPGAKAKRLSPKDKERNILEIQKIAEVLCESEEMELVHIEYNHKDGSDIIRVYIDKPGGVYLDDCVYINRQLSDLLDINLNMESPYRLEVSSPGTDRPLIKESDFQRFRGKQVKIRTKNSIEGQKNFKGVLLGISEGIVELMTGDKTITVPYQEISRARLVNDVGDCEC